MDALDMSEIEPESQDKLDRRNHIKRLINVLTKPLPSHFERLVATQTWCVYWITHSLSLLDKCQVSEPVTDDVISFINECAHEHGGYGGGPGQISHLATTFAAINALITTSSEKALDSIDRAGIVKFLHRMKQADGSFSMHDDGEIDSRATYCALSILKCLNIHDPLLMENLTDWILSCQTYEGGFGSVPGAEAHGGYTFCCVASLSLMDQLHKADIPALARWLANKQLTDEGGFCGRSNKLVDSCYSYWQGAVFVLIHPLLKSLATQSSQQNRPQTRSSAQNVTDTEVSELFNLWMFDSRRLQDYILNNCQADDGMLRDKPGVEPDAYHTCYALSGLSLSQHQPGGSIFDIGAHAINILENTHPIFNLTPENLNHCIQYFQNKRVDVMKETQRDE